MKEVSFQRMMVALDLSAHDDELIRYAAWLAGVLRVKKLYFVHFVKNLLTPHKDYLLDRDDIPLDERIRQEIRQKIEEHVEGSDMEIEVVLEEEHPLEGLLRWQTIKKVDVILVGKKKLTEGSGVICRQLARQTACAVLFVPSGARLKVEKIWVPVDFSDNSRNALSLALKLHNYFQEPEVICQHVYFAAVHSGKIKVKSQYPKFVYQSALEKCESFLQPFKASSTPVKMVFTPDEGADTVSKIIDAAQSDHADLLVMGAVGHSRLKLLTVGSTAEKMMLADLRIPLLIVKDQARGR